MTVTPHLCCGCSCHVCANGHAAGEPGNEHTKECWDRLLQEAMDANWDDVDFERSMEPTP